MVRTQFAFGGTNDQFTFAYTLMDGDFDLQCRVESLLPVAAWTRAGLLARESLEPGSRFAGAMTCPTQPGQLRR
jgi:hypothetical protein